ncbi:hypothetical protein CUR178_05906 [Leishmania enriettii]|uniref:non-specific serine/threonine protein kinase n=1 Tax=Leishmania enriettii TaxID=5663 RepID=A0A836KND5_LEIEN|nr:hypothetical protein CUR178_05906 [Leishmania enriettii]
MPGFQKGNHTPACRGAPYDENAPPSPSDGEVQRRQRLFSQALRSACIAIRVGDSPDYTYSLELLGAGAFGAVTLAFRHEGDGVWRKTAVKRISLRKERRLSAVLEMVRCAGREVALCRRSGGSPHVVPMYEPWFDCREGVIALPMDAGDCSLERYAVHCSFRFPPVELLSICVQCVRAVAYVHRCGVVHRDVKPDNFVVNVFGTGSGGGCGGSGGGCGGARRPPHVRILDFGLACGLEEAEQELTRCVGTLHYMAPEMFAEGGGCDLPTARDVWSLGVTLFRLATGVFPVFEEDVAASRPNASDSCTPLLLPTCDYRGHELSREPRAVLAVAASMLALNPQHRPTIASVLLELESIVAVPESTLSSMSPRVHQLRVCRPDVVVAMYATPQATEEQALPWRLRPGDTFLVKGGVERCTDGSCASASSSYRSEWCQTRLPSPQKRLGSVPPSPLQRALSCAAPPPASDLWLRVVYPHKGFCRGFVEGQHVVHVVTHPGSMDAHKRCSPLRPLLHHAERAQDAASTHQPLLSQRTPSTVPLYIDVSREVPLQHRRGCLASRVAREKSPSPLHGPYRCCTSPQQQRPLR